MAIPLILIRLSAQIREQIETASQLVLDRYWTTQCYTFRNLAEVKGLDDSVLILRVNTNLGVEGLKRLGAEITQIKPNGIVVVDLYKNLYKNLDLRKVLLDNCGQVRFLLPGYNPDKFADAICWAMR